MERPAVVALINTSPDTVEMLRLALEHVGFTVVTGYVHDIRSGKLDFEAFLRQHRPAVIVWDIALPYDKQWHFFQHIKASPMCAGCRFVLTTTNARAVTAIGAADEPLYEILGKPYDLGELVRAVKHVVGDAQAGP